MEINERIQLVRKNKGLSRRAFGEELGVSESVIVNIEYDRLKRPDQKEPLYRLICEKFNVNEEWLRTGAGGEENMFNKISPISQTYNHFGYIMENATPQKKAVLTTLIEMVYSIDDEKWDYICDQFQKCLEEGKKGKA